MSNDIVLGASMRANLFSLQSTNSLIEATQFKLSSGRKVNSALDGPQSFFTAQSLSNRASDLNKLLDAMGQSLSTIKEADKGVTALTKLVDQADAIATQARDALASGAREAKITSSVNLKGVTTLDDLSGITGGTSAITLTVTDPEDGSTVSLANSGTVTIAATDSIDELVTNINNLDDGRSESVIEAKLNDAGQLEIHATNGGKLRVAFDSGTEDQAFAAALGFAKAGIDEYTDAATVDNYAVTVSATATVDSQVLYKSPNTVADRSTALKDLVTSDGTALGFTNVATDKIVVGVNGKSLETLNAGLNTMTIQGFVDEINTNSDLNTLIKADFDETTGKISIQAVDSSVQNVQIGVTTGAASIATSAFGFGTQASLSTSATSGRITTESIRFGAAAAELASLEKDFNKVREQIDSAAQDSSYRGINLLKGDDLTTVFNEDSTSKLVSKGVTFTSAGLGINAADFGREASVQGSLDEVKAALTSVRTFATALANDQTIIQTRQDFTNNTISTLQEGSDKLTVADQNEEGAKMLALQTRMQLSVISLSLANQSQQSVLRLF